jgi:hypothetical protein
MSDPFLICYGLANDYIVLTEENQRSELRIPHVCRELGVECLNIGQFFEHNGWRF